MRTWRPECSVRGCHTILHGLSILRLLLFLLVLMVLAARFGGDQIGDLAPILVYHLIIFIMSPTAVHIWSGYRYAEREHFRLSLRVGPC